MSFKEELANKASHTDELLKSFLPDITDSYEKTIYEAMSYSVLAGGKRLRPIFLIETFELLYDKNDSIEYDILKKAAGCCGAALEMIHTYSLVHDDLPAMDNDLYRRGKETTHAKFGHAMGILAGDALLNLAGEILFSAPAKLSAMLPDKEKPEIYERLIKAGNIIYSKAGSQGMIGGQVIDIEAEGKEVSNDKLLKMYKLKTSALLEAAMMAGAVLAGADEKKLDDIEKIACNIGLAFQIQDDILDETSTIEELGKPIHSDIKNQKPTYVAINGLENSQKAVSELTLEALEIYDKLDGKNEFLRELILSLVDRKY